MQMGGHDPPKMYYTARNLVMLQAQDFMLGGKITKGKWLPNLFVPHYPQQSIVLGVEITVKGQ